MLTLGTSKSKSKAAILRVPRVSRLRRAIMRAAPSVQERPRSSPGRGRVSCCCLGGQLCLRIPAQSTHSSICLMMLGFSDGTPLLECRPLPTMTLSCRPFRLSTSQKAGLASAPFQHHAKFIRTFFGPLDGLFPAQSVHVYRVGLKVS